MTPTTDQAQDSTTYRLNGVMAGMSINLEFTDRDQAERKAEEYASRATWLVLATIVNGHDVEHQIYS